MIQRLIKWFRKLFEQEPELIYWDHFCGASGCSKQAYDEHMRTCGAWLEGGV